MKFVLLIDNLASGGAQRQVCYLANGLAARGHDVRLVLYNPGLEHFADLIDYENVAVTRLKRGEKRGFSLKTLLSIRDAFKKCDTVVSFMPTANIYSTLAGFGLSNIRLFTGERTSEKAPRPLPRLLLSYLAHLLAEKVVCNSYSNAVYWREWLGLRNKVVTIWNGYAMTPQDLAPVIERQDKRSILVLGRLAYPKNTYRLIQALDLFLERNGWVPVVNFVGRPDVDPLSLKMREKINRFLDVRPELSASLRWVGESKNVDEWFVTCDALALVSVYEGLPNVICEAFQRGLPVIASEVCDNVKLVGDDERGILCDPFNPNSICASFETFFKMSACERMAMAERAQRFAKVNLDQELMIQAYEQL